MKSLKAWDLRENPTVFNQEIGLIRLIFPLDDEAVISVEHTELTLSPATICIVDSEACILPNLVMSCCYVLEFDKLMWLEFFRFFPQFRPVLSMEKLNYIEVDIVNPVAARLRLAQLVEETKSNVPVEHQKLLFGLFMLDIVLPKGGVTMPVQNINGMRVELDEILEVNFKSERSTRYYARRVGVSPRRLNALCRMWFDGKAFFAVLMERLLFEAEHRLTYSVDPIKAIAFELGFKSPQNFRMYFVRYRGISPLEFRKRTALS